MILGFVIINVTTINIYNTITILTTTWSGALTLENIIINVTTINIINTTIILTLRWSGALTLENMFLAQSTPSLVKRSFFQSQDVQSPAARFISYYYLMVDILWDWCFINIWWILFYSFLRPRTRNMKVSYISFYIARVILYVCPCGLWWCWRVMYGPLPQWMSRATYPLSQFLYYFYSSFSFVHPFIHLFNYISIYSLIALLNGPSPHTYVKVSSAYIYVYTHPLIHSFISSHNG